MSSPESNAHGRTAMDYIADNARQPQSASRDAGMAASAKACLAQAEREDGAMAFSLIDDDKGAVPLTALNKAQLARWRESAPARERDWAVAAGFTGAAGKIALVPDKEGKLGRVLV